MIDWTTHRLVVERTDGSLAVWHDYELVDEDTGELVKSEPPIDRDEADRIELDRIEVDRGRAIDLANGDEDLSTVPANKKRRRGKVGPSDDAPRHGTSESL